MKTLTRSAKNYKHCIPWWVCPGCGYACMNMCSDTQHKMFKEKFEEDKVII